MNKLILILLMAIIFVPSARATTIDVPKLKESNVIVNGKCNDWEWNNANSTNLGQGVKLKTQQTNNLLYLCFELPPESIGTVDMYIDTPKLKAPKLLHVSAKAGEKINDSDSWDWWNNEYWNANVSRFDKCPSESPKGFGYFTDAPAREFQFYKPAFGEGEWKLLIKLHSIKSADGKYIEFKYPEKGKREIIGSWLTLKL